MPWLVGSGQSPSGLLLLGVFAGLETLGETEAAKGSSCLKCGELFNWTAGLAGKKKDQTLTNSRNSHKLPQDISAVQRSPGRDLRVIGRGGVHNSWEPRTTEKN